MFYHEINLGEISLQLCQRSSSQLGLPVEYLRINKEKEKLRQQPSKHDMYLMW